MHDVWQPFTPAMRFSQRRKSKRLNVSQLSPLGRVPGAYWLEHACQLEGCLVSGGIMRQVSQGTARGVLAFLCASILLLQATALPLLHVVHWVETAAVVGASETGASCCPHGHGPALGSADPFDPRHDPTACTTCTVLAQHRLGTIVVLALGAAPPAEGVGLTSDVHRFDTAAPRGVAAPRAPPFLRA
jgi:hypothetical protein